MLIALIFLLLPSDDALLIALRRRVSQDERKFPRAIQSQHCIDCIEIIQSVAYFLGKGLGVHRDCQPSKNRISNGSVSSIKSHVVLWIEVVMNQTTTCTVRVLYLYTYCTEGHPSVPAARRAFFGCAPGGGGGY